ncbi:type I methionyl aminopeptidase [Helcococcus ovis]|uniref:Methionine aminopeptidase n=1 Tax=Helcococcus ovis TaxID=72026 RepID=A0A4R9C2X4_9FIRM|nr:type I methionyl aminopeptidase [Helcococcus ovis]TFF65475.1 type I methionyl aminopeptidase [Helcococcus ovis]TFF65713.1 type I methionyl aminopeptidase [Helcococcus ovis]TFF68479.1 type I methionyl aminopeptidase [Helcococcus ovis]WNZ01462.1 type I methionyl aminopeptidase [Helcococcus ovis]
MITLKTKEEIEGMRKSGEILCKTHLAIREILRPGLTTLQVNDFAEAFMKFKNAIPKQKGYEGFPYALCTSLNDVICHGFPKKEDVLKEGDILSIDNVVDYNGYLSDSCWSYAIGKISEEDKKLMEVTKNSMYLGIEQAVAGNRIGDIGNAIQTYVESEGFSVVRDFVGHGIGKEMHEDPQVPHYGKSGRGRRLMENMVITVEPMINVGTWMMKIDSDGWTARTRDGKKSCQFEHTFVVRDGKADILTNQDDYELNDEEKQWIKNYKF